MQVKPNRTSSAVHLDCNDMKVFLACMALIMARISFQYLKDNFDCLYEEGATAPKLMSIGIIVEPLETKPLLGMKTVLITFKSPEKVWIARAKRLPIMDRGIIRLANAFLKMAIDLSGAIGHLSYEEVALKNTSFRYGHKDGMGLT